MMQPRLNDKVSTRGTKWTDAETKLLVEIWKQGAATGAVLRDLVREANKNGSLKQDFRACEQKIVRLRDAGWDIPFIRRNRKIRHNMKEFIAVVESAHEYSSMNGSPKSISSPILDAKQLMWGGRNEILYYNGNQLQSISNRFEKENASVIPEKQFGLRREADSCSIRMNIAFLISNSTADEKWF
uniref:Myb-like domain-containing protein n=1 Tax=Hanusia phi TaxID=3032 RepID=A0A7S0EEF3_9CRYP|mmetsp:Transcript_21759/g.49272  ORF Transcript_21759/g.49272 Transcript_21759/m.49272 type:complete len:185 (+) Transcript_21759:32-586(+)